MPRKTRIVTIGYPHHITQRGNHKQTVFTTNTEYIKYLKWFDEYAKKYDLTILAYCLMPNHVHFVAIPEKENSFAKIFNICQMRYAQYFNKKHNLTGHL
jgi:putative transposase